MGTFSPLSSAQTHKAIVMCSKFHLQLFLLACTTSAFCSALEVKEKDKRQVGAITLQKEDHETSETGWGGPAAVHAGSKYFQYAHNPVKDHYEHGHKRGNEHHFIERHEKAHPHAGEFKTKVRWGDKHGGYGEHYWDYNHAGHHDGEGEESQQKEEYAAYDESQQSALYAQPQTLPLQERGKRQPSFEPEAEFINPRAKARALSGQMEKHGGNYKTERDYGRDKREHGGHGTINGADLVFEPKLGMVVDEKTGITYELKPVEF